MPQRVQSAPAQRKSASKEAQRGARSQEQSAWHTGLRYSFGDIPIAPPDGAGEREAEQVARQLPDHRLPGVRAQALRTLDASGPGSLDSSGRALPDAVQQWFQGRLGYHLGSVRIHTDARATQLNQELGAAAFTLGRHIYFADPRGAADPHLLAHELTHVVQQTRQIHCAPAASAQTPTPKSPDAAPAASVPAAPPKPAKMNSLEYLRTHLESTKLYTRYGVPEKKPESAPAKGDAAKKPESPPLEEPRHLSDAEVKTVAQAIIDSFPNKFVKDQIQAKCKSPHAKVTGLVYLMSLFRDLATLINHYSSIVEMPLPVVHMHAKAAERLAAVYRQVAAAGRPLPEPDKSLGFSVRNDIQVEPSFEHGEVKRRSPDENPHLIGYAIDYRTTTNTQLKREGLVGLTNLVLREGALADSNGAHDSFNAVLGGFTSSRRRIKAMGMRQAAAEAAPPAAVPPVKEATATTPEREEKPPAAAAAPKPDDHPELAGTTDDERAFLLSYEQEIQRLVAASARLQAAAPPKIRQLIAQRRRLEGIAQALAALGNEETTLNKIKNNKRVTEKQKEEAEVRLRQIAVDANKLKAEKTSLEASNKALANDKAGLVKEWRELAQNKKATVLQDFNKELPGFTFSLVVKKNSKETTGAELLASLADKKIPQYYELVGGYSRSIAESAAKLGALLKDANKDADGLRQAIQGIEKLLHPAEGKAAAPPASIKSPSLAEDVALLQQTLAALAREIPAPAAPAAAPPVAKGAKAAAPKPDPLQVARLKAESLQKDLDKKLTAGLRALGHDIPDYATLQDKANQLSGAIEQAQKKLTQMPRFLYYADSWHVLSQIEKDLSVGEYVNKNFYTGAASDPSIYQLAVLGFFNLDAAPENKAMAGKLSGSQGFDKFFMVTMVRHGFYHAALGWSKEDLKGPLQGSGADPQHFELTELIDTHPGR